MIKKNIQMVTISSIHFSPWIPYAAGCLISYCKNIPEINKQYTFAEPIFRYQAVELYDDIISNADILGITCYVWNQAYNDKLAARYKDLRPDGIVIYGGPNIPEEDDLRKKFINSRPYLDLMFTGPGEKNFSEWLLGNSTEGTTTQDTSNVDLKKMRKSYQITGNEIPTPYSDGIFDSIFENSTTMLKASFETNRGCPYSCAFCDWGGQARSKLTVFDISQVHSQLDYIYSKKNVSEIEMLDANFGVLARDVDITKYMIDLADVNNNPIKLGYAGLAKNGSKHTTEILNLMGKGLKISQRNNKLSFQSHTPQVLKNIDRGNIDNNKLLPVLEQCKKDGVTTTSELIMALPGETAESWLATIAHNHSLGIDYIRTYILNYVPNTTMYKKEYREKFNITAKTIRFSYAINSKTYKDLHNNKDFQVSEFTDYEEYEIMTGCSSWDLDEIVKMFDYTWWYHNMWNGGALRSVVSSDIKKEIKLFFRNIEKMPMMSSILEKHRSIVRTLYSPGSLEKISDLGTYLFYSKCLRTDDLEIIWQNQDQFVLEMSILYGHDKMAKCVEDYKKTFSMSLYGTDANILENPHNHLQSKCISNE